MNEEDAQVVINYFRNKASELELQNVDLQIQVMKLAKQVEQLQNAEVNDEGSD